MANKGSFPLVSFSDVYVVVSTPKVYFCEILGSLEFIDEFIDDGKRVVVLNCVLV